METPKKLINLDFLIENMGNKKTEIIEIIDIFCEQLPQDMTELSAAIINTDYPNIRQFAHRMKSTLSLLGVEGMLNIAKEIEAKSKEEKDIEEIRELNKYFVKHFSQVLKEAQEEKNKLMTS